MTRRMVTPVFTVFSFLQIVVLSSAAFGSGVIFSATKPPESIAIGEAWRIDVLVQNIGQKEVVLSRLISRIQYGDEIVEVPGGHSDFGMSFAWGLGSANRKYTLRPNSARIVPFWIFAPATEDAPPTKMTVSLSMDSSSNSENLLVGNLVISVFDLKVVSPESTIDIELLAKYKSIAENSRSSGFDILAFVRGEVGRIRAEESGRYASETFRNKTKEIVAFRQTEAKIDAVFEGSRYYSDFLIRERCWPNSADYAFVVGNYDHEEYLFVADRDAFDFFDSQEYFSICRSEVRYCIKSFLLNSKAITPGGFRDATDACLFLDEPWMKAVQDVADQRFASISSAN